MALSGAFCISCQACVDKRTFRERLIKMWLKGVVFRGCGMEEKILYRGDRGGCLSGIPLSPARVDPVFDRVGAGCMAAPSGCEGEQKDPCEKERGRWFFYASALGCGRDAALGRGGYADRADESVAGGSSCTADEVLPVCGSVLLRDRRYVWDRQGGQPPVHIR